MLVDDHSMDVVVVYVMKLDTSQTNGTPRSTYSVHLFRHRAQKVFIACHKNSLISADVTQGIL